MRSEDAGERTVACTRRHSTDTSYSSATPDAPCNCCAVHTRRVRRRPRGGAGPSVGAARRRADLADAPDREEREFGEAALGDDRVGDLELDGLEVADALPELMAACARVRPRAPAILRRSRAPSPTTAPTRGSRWRSIARTGCAPWLGVRPGPRTAPAGEPNGGPRDLCAGDAAGERRPRPCHAGGRRGRRAGRPGRRARPARRRPGTASPRPGRGARPGPLPGTARSAASAWSTSASGSMSNAPSARSASAAETRSRGRLRRRARQVDAAEVGEGTPSGCSQLDDVVGEHEIHQGRPTVARPTIMRWISMVPDATVAACA